MSDGRADEISTAVRKPVDVSPSRHAVYRLSVVEGPDLGHTFEVAGVEGERVHLGTSSTCEIRLTDREVSRRHVVFEAADRELRVHDLGSTNGTRVNGVRVTEAYLSGEETLRIGGSTLFVEVVESDAPVDLPAATSFGRVVGTSAAMRRLYAKCEKLAASNVSVLIEGETGTGKEALAESLHEQGPRAAGPFIVFDCSAVAPTLIEAELFGHERGAFTGAVSSREGAFEQANGGTMLIDEIGELDPALQPKLLRALERGEVRRVGGDRWVKVDVRILAATRRDLDCEVQEGRFRDDLFFRVAVARVELPPLRARRGDIALLVRHFAKLLGKEPDAVPYATLERFERHAWPGNVRELANAVARYFALGDEPLPASGARASSASKPAARDPIDEVIALDLSLPLARQRLVAEFERRYIESVLAKYDGSVARAAAASGIARRYFNVLLARRRQETP